MEPGLRLKNIREKLGLRYREVEQASHQIAQRQKNSDFIVGLSRLADIENKGVVPNFFRIYSLCAIYRLDFDEVLSWYGVRVDDIWRDIAHIQPANTHPVELREPRKGSVSLPLQLEPGVDFSETTYLSRVIQEWGRVPLLLLQSLDIENYRFGLIGFEDYRMYPMIPPGALVQIDDQRVEIADSGWSGEFDRPIYFVETRQGYACCWCSLSENHLILQPHSGSPAAPEILRYPQDVDVIGQVTGVAMQLEIKSARRGTKKRKNRSATARG